MACCPQTRRWRTGRIRLPCPITACTAPSRPRRKSCCRRYSGAYRQAVPGKKPTHTGRDATKEATGIKHEISIHAPHTGRDLHRCVGQAHDAHFNPRAPYGARPSTTPPCSAGLAISIHAPHTGRDATPQLWIRRSTNFNPRAPYEARLAIVPDQRNLINISIHAPHTGRDWYRTATAPLTSPFQSTRPIRGATGEGERMLLPALFQSTRPIRGATELPLECAVMLCNFNPRAPYGARR